MSLQKFFQPYKTTNRPYQSLPQTVLVAIEFFVALAGLLTVAGILPLEKQVASLFIVPGVVCLIMLEWSAFPQAKYWRARSQQGNPAQKD